MARKNVDLNKLVKQGNHFLKNSPDDMRDLRKGAAMMIENALHLANAYKGFSYLNEENMKDSIEGKSLGIIFDDSVNQNHVYPDDSRVFYYI